ncbi:ABC transporter permease [Athalassotoga saccharophila]|uniref:ABC transporter permease n=1 Tax=Athalassotoga saccharophila TaxID=1441386 RepID=UPI00137A59C3|nr:ABC transporter permease [Athalassotoga saccharophila]BBJ27382.1 putative aliphatic sulfonates transport permease protein SsuC [Athalassotoga saccharophila]
MKILFGILIFLIAWQIFAAILNVPLILPSPYLTFKSLYNLALQQETYQAIFSTVWKSLLVLLMVIAIGTPVGFLMGISESVYQIFRPAITVVQAVPVISWLALVIFVWGIGWKGPVVISFLSLLPISIFTTAAGVRSTDKSLIEMARVYKVPQVKIIRTIYLGSLVPFVFSTVEVIIGDVWKVIVVSEYLCGSDGIGVLISWARQYVDVPRIYALTIIAVTLGIASERLVKIAFKKVLEKWQMQS